MLYRNHTFSSRGWGVRGKERTAKSLASYIAVFCGDFGSTVVKCAFWSLMPKVSGF